MPRRLTRGVRGADTYSVNRREMTVRALALPVAMVGMAIAAPEGLAVSNAVAEQVIERTVGRAEALSGQISRSLRDWCGERDVRCGAAAAPIDAPPTDDCPATFALTDRHADRPAPAPPRHALIDLPPPM